MDKPVKTIETLVSPRMENVFYDHVKMYTQNDELKHILRNKTAKIADLKRNKIISSLNSS